MMVISGNKASLSSDLEEQSTMMVISGLSQSLGVDLGALKV